MENLSGLTPLDVKVLVLPDGVDEKTVGGIILPDSTKDQKKYAATRGTLIAVGANAFAEWGQGAAIPVGGRVAHAQYAGLRIKGNDGTDYLIMNDEDIVGTVAS